MAQAEARAAAREAARATAAGQGAQLPFQRQTTTTKTMKTKALALDALALEVKRSPQEEATLNGFMRKTEKTLELMTAQIHALQKMVQILFLDSNRRLVEWIGDDCDMTPTRFGDGSRHTHGWGSS